MRPSNKRSRSKQNRPRTLGNIVNRVFDSSGPEGKVRGTPQQIIDKYALLARDAQLSGDRVAAENFLQHAEHYTRMLNEAQAEMARDGEQRRDGGFQQNGQQGQTRRFDQNGEGEGEAEGSESFEPRQTEGRQNDGRQNDGRQGDGRQSEPRGEARPAEGRPADARPADARPSEPRNDNRQDWKDRRNKRFDERRARRDSTDPRDESRPAQPGDAESMLVETPESRSEPRPEPRREPRAEPRSEPKIESQLPDFLTTGFAPPPPAVADAESVETAPKARPRGRPRKPRAETEGDTPAASSDAAE